MIFLRNYKSSSTVKNSSNDYVCNRIVSKSFNLQKNLYEHESRKTCETDTFIKFRKDIKFGDSPLSLWLKLGKSSYEYVRKSNYKYKILLYKTYLGKIKTKIEYHFFNNKLFFVSYSFSDVLSYNNIIQTLNKKYKLNESISLEKIKVIDKQGTVMYLDRLFEFTINYISGDQSIISDIEEKLSLNISLDNKKEKKQLDILFENL
jgi:hypothetical protein